MPPPIGGTAEDVVEGEVVAAGEDVVPAEALAVAVGEQEAVERRPERLGPPLLMLRMRALARSGLAVAVRQTRQQPERRLLKEAAQVLARLELAVAGLRGQEMQQLKLQAPQQADSAAPVRERLMRLAQQSAGLEAALA